MNATFGDELLIRVEEAGINASAPREQLWIDGWLVRFSPGKAKRARCIQAVAPGRLALEARLRRCIDLYRQAGLRAFVRVTPYSQPAGLDEWLAAQGMERIDDTRVMVASLAGPKAVGPASTVLVGISFEKAEADAFARWIGTQRGSSSEEQQAHAERLRHAPVPHRALFVLDATGAVIAGGQIAVEHDLAGLYDIFTTRAERGRGVGSALCQQLLSHGGAQGARTAYLQVEANNDAARRIYRRLGFEDAYAYHYRTPPDE